MEKISEIKEYLKSNNIFSVLYKYHEVDELYIILNILIEEHKFHSISAVLSKFPLTNEFDEIKKKALNQYSDYLDSYQLMNLISKISSDEVKFDLFYKYFDKFEENYEITYVINSLKNDNLKGKTFREYIKYYDSETFSDYLRKLKDDNLRTSEFLLYKNQFPDFRLDWIADSYLNDEEKMKIFNKYYDDSKKEQIPLFICYLNKDESKIACLDYYCELISPNRMHYITSSLKTKKAKMGILKKFSKKMTSDDLKGLLLGIDDEKIRLELLNKVHNLMKSRDIMEIIIEIKDHQTKLEIFKRYIEIFTDQDLFTMYLYVDDDKKELFLDEYINYYDSYILYRICIYHISYNEEYITDKILNKYINLFNALSLSWLIEKMLAFKIKNNIKMLVQNLLEKTNSKDTIKIIYNAVALADAEYFKNELYKNDKIFSQEEKNICNKLSNNNPYFFNYFIFGLLDIPKLHNNLPFLSQISKYPRIAQKIVDLYKTNPNNINLLLTLLELVYQYDINYDNITNSLIEEFSNPKNKFLDNLDASQLNKNNLLILIFKLINVNKEDKDIIDIEINDKNDLENYEILLNSKLDMIFEKSKNIEEIKNVLLNKIFGVSLSEACKLLETYGVSLNKFSNDIPLRWIKMIKEIIEDDNIDNLNDIYNSCQKLNIEEKILMDQKIKKFFNKRISDALYKINDKQPSGHLKYGNTLIPFYVPGNEFYLLVNSLSAYEYKSEILDYNKFWNFNEKVQNHGICCSLISNQNVGQTAPIEDIIVGFEDFSDNAIQLANSNDLSSTTDDLDMNAISSIRFMMPEDYVDNTRTSHNELVLERRELRHNKNLNYINIQPSYVVIYDTFDEDKVNRSLKAAQELNISVLFLNTNNIALNESKILDQYKNYIMETFDINVFNKLIVRFENNIYGFSLSNLNIIKVHFSKEKFNEFIEQFLLKIYKSLQDGTIEQSLAKSLFNQIITIIQKETEKCKGKQVSESLDKEYIAERVKYYINLTEQINNHKTL